MNNIADILKCNVNGIKLKAEILEKLDADIVLLSKTRFSDGVELEATFNAEIAEWSIDNEAYRPYFMAIEDDLVKHI